MIAVTLTELGGSERVWHHLSKSTDHWIALQAAASASFGEDYGIHAYQLSSGLHGRAFRADDHGDRRYTHLLRIEFS